MSGERQFGPCSKCTGTAITVQYHEGVTHCRTCTEVISCKFSSGCGKNGYKGEHLAVRCDRCKWGWVELVSDVKQEGDPSSPDLL